LLAVQGPKRAAVNCSKGFRLGLPETQWEQIVFLRPRIAEAIFFFTLFASFENCGAWSAIQWFVMTTSEIQAKPNSGERGWSGFPRRD